MSNTSHLRRQHFKSAEKARRSPASKPAHPRSPASRGDKSSNGGCHGWLERGRRAPSREISLVALMLAAGVAPRSAQTDARSDHGARHQDDEKTIDALAMVSSVRQEQTRPDPADSARRTCSSDCRACGSASAATAPETSINIRGLQDFGRVAVVIDGARQNFQRSGHNANVVPQPLLRGAARAPRGVAATPRRGPTGAADPHLCRA